MKGSQFNEVKNQFIIESDMGTMFQSYDSPIALIDKDGEVHLSKHYDYSKTTMKYLGRFLGHGVAETRKKIQSGEYKLDLSLEGVLMGEVA
jgi:hypothetical protein